MYKKRMVGAFAALSLLLTACGGDGGDAGTDPGTGGNGGGETQDAAPVELEFWAWASNVDKVVDIWNEQNSHIQVNISAPVGGADMPTRVLSAVRAGDGPDMIQAEYTQLPTYVTAGVVANLDEIRGDIEGTFAPSILETVSFDGTLFGIPQDLGPALFLYRTDLFEEHGLTPPTTWEEFRTLAEEVRELEENHYLLNFSSMDADQFMGLSLQNGAQWWNYENDAWEVAIDDPATQEVLQFWQGMVEDDLVSTYQTNSPEQIEAGARGETLAAIAGAWAPGPFLNQYPDTVGMWDAAQIPQWDLADPRVYARGGSSNAVVHDTEHMAEALEFLLWLNASDEGAEALVDANKFTGNLHGQEIDRDPPALMPDNDSYWPSAAEAAENLLVVQWGPNTQVAFTALNDALGQAIEGQISWDEVLPQVEDRVKTDLGQ